MRTYHKVYFSPTGTTKSVVNKVADSISDDFILHDLTSSERDEFELSLIADDFLVVGVPVYSGHIPQLIEDSLKKISGKGTPVALIATYGNREYDYAIEEMREIFTQNGFVVISTATFIGEHSYTSKVAQGRPDDSDILIASRYGESLKNILSRRESFADEYEVYESEQNIPERHASLPLAPVTGEACDGCGVCQENCPSNTILSCKPHVIKEVRCIRCHACVKKCPQSAIFFDERLAHVSKRLISQCTIVRKEPEIKFLCI